MAVVDLATYRAQRLARERAALPRPSLLGGEAHRAVARAAFEAAGEMPASWLKNSPHPEPRSNAASGSPTVA